MIVGAALVAAPVHAHDRGQSRGQDVMPVAAAAATGDYLEVRVEVGGAGDAPVVAITLGELVTISVIGAGTGELHVHGYDLEVPATDGQPAVFALEATYSGRFPVMTHVHDPLLGDREKAVFYLDVRTR